MNKRNVIVSTCARGTTKPHSTTTLATLGRLVGASSSSSSSSPLLANNASMTRVPSARHYRRHRDLSGQAAGPARLLARASPQHVIKAHPSMTVIGTSYNPLVDSRRNIGSLPYKKDNIWGEAENKSNKNPSGSHRDSLQVESFYRQGVIYHHGLGADQDLPRAFALYRRAATSGHQDAICAIASMYAAGEGVEFADYSKARALYNTAAVLGHAHAQYKLGEIYESGLGVPVDMKMAHRWYSESAKHKYPQALCSLGTMYAEGAEGIPCDPVKAAALLQAAADQGLANAQCCLAMLFASGEGVNEGSESLAEEYYLRAAEQGHALAQLNLGHLYYNQGNAEMAKDLWEMAAKQGVSIAFCNLGAMYSAGQGVPQSYAKAFEYYSVAADKGDFEAQYQMGLLYEHGYGVQQQRLTAQQWFKKAASQGHDEARKYLREFKAAAPAPIIDPLSDALSSPSSPSSSSAPQIEAATRMASAHQSHRRSSPKKP